MPRVTMLAGPNGSGKSSLKAYLDRRGVDWGEHFNADDIARTLAGDPRFVAAAAQQRVRDGRDAALRARRDYSWETVMSHPSHIDHLRTARAMGYTARLFYVATDDPLTNVGRVADRVALGGHTVPVDRIIERYWKSIGLLPGAVAASDDARIFDNSDPDHAFRLVLHRNGGQITITDDLPPWLDAVAVAVALDA